MSTLHRWRVWRAVIARILPHLAIAASLPLLATPFLLRNHPRAEYLAGSLSDFGMILCLASVMLLLGRWQVRLLKQQADDIMLMVAGAVADSMAAHLQPDSTWRLNLIKEIADSLNDYDAIALAAIEGSVLDLGKRLSAIDAELARLRRET